jgi:hypothetical protein
MQSYVIYLDFRKAFDSVPHQRLLKKLEAIGIKDSILIWIENFLSDRQQRRSGEWKMDRNPYWYNTSLARNGAYSIHHLY